MFHLSSADAAGELGISINHLKRTCRRIGIDRWPYRKLESLKTLLQEIANDPHLMEPARKVCARCMHGAVAPPPITDRGTVTSVMQGHSEYVTTFVERVMADPNQKVGLSHRGVIAWGRMQPQPLTTYV